MKTSASSSPHRWALVSGDAIALIALVGFGFASHRELGSAPWNRVLATAVPLVLGWFPLAWALGLYGPLALTRRGGGLTALAAVYAACFLAIVRAAWLHLPAQPLFALIMALFAIVFLSAFRVPFAWLHRRSSAQ